MTTITFFALNREANQASAQLEEKVQVLLAQWGLNLPGFYDALQVHIVSLVVRIDELNVLLSQEALEHVTNHSIGLEELSTQALEKHCEYTRQLMRVTDELRDSRKVLEWFSELTFRRPLPASDQLPAADANRSAAEETFTHRI